MNKPISNCCKEPLKKEGDTEEGTFYYVCTKCNKSCDIYSGDNHPALKTKPLSEEKKSLITKADVHHPMCVYKKSNCMLDCNCQPPQDTQSNQKSEKLDKESVIKPELDIQEKQECKHKGGQLLNAVRGCDSCAKELPKIFGEDNKEWEWEGKFDSLFGFPEEENGYIAAKYDVLKSFIASVVDEEREKIKNDLLKAIKPSPYYKSMSAIGEIPQEALSKDFILEYFDTKK